MNEFLVSHSYWILVLPFLSFLVNGLFLCKNHRKAAGALSVTLAGLSMLYAVALVVSYVLSAARKGSSRGNSRFSPFRTG